MSDLMSYLQGLRARNWENEKVLSVHVPAIKFIGKKQLV